MVGIREYVTAQGRNVYARWFDRLSAPAAATRVATALVRMELGNLAGTKAVGAGVFECHVDFGPGFRVYFGRDGDALIILLGGSTKRRQQTDIKAARTLWRDDKRRKRQET